MKHNFTPEKLEALETKALKNLRQNAADKGAVDLVAMCDKQLATRSVRTPRKGTRQRPDDQRFLEAEGAAGMAALAKQLAIRFDVSAATAKQLSADFSGFRAHELVGKTGDAKLGGLQRRGLVAIDRYISYKMGDNLVRLSLLLASNQPVEAARWIVHGPEHLLPNRKPITQLVGGLEEIDEKLISERAIAYADFDEAAQKFEEMISELAPAK